MRHPLSRGHVLVLAAAFGFSFIFVFAKLLEAEGVSSLMQVAFRSSFSVMLLLPALRGLDGPLVRREDLPLFLGLGTLFSVFLLDFLSCLALGASALVAVALLYTQPLWTMIMAMAAGEEEFRPSRLGLVLVAMVGVVLVAGEPAGDPSTRTGVILAAASGLLYALYLRGKRALSRRDYPPLRAQLAVFLLSLPSLAVLALALSSSSLPLEVVGLAWPTGRAVIIGLLFALVATTGPYTLLTMVDTDEVGPTEEGIVLLLDPVLTTLWAALFYAQAVVPLQGLGGALVLASAAGAIATSHRGFEGR